MPRIIIPEITDKDIIGIFQDFWQSVKEYGLKEFYILLFFILIGFIIFYFIVNAPFMFGLDISTPIMTYP